MLILIFIIAHFNDSKTKPNKLKYTENITLHKPNHFQLHSLVWFKKQHAINYDILTSLSQVFEAIFRVCTQLLIMIKCDAIAVVDIAQSNITLNTNIVGAILNFVLIAQFASLLYYNFYHG